MGQLGAPVAALPLRAPAVGLPGARKSDFGLELPPGQPARLHAIAPAIRGADAPPAIFVHGVLPRSGTNFLGDTLALHPHVHANPGRLWEFPLLYVAPGAEALQWEFLSMFTPNAEVMGRFDLLAYLASGWLAALQKEAGQRRLLLKSPHVQHLPLFRHIFPDDILILCLRDGRDVIQSSIGTFGRWHPRNKGFAEIAREWRYATETILSFEPAGGQAYSKRQSGALRGAGREHRGGLTRYAAPCAARPRGFTTSVPLIGCRCRDRQRSRARSIDAGRRTTSRRTSSRSAAGARRGRAIRSVASRRSRAGP